MSHGHHGHRGGMGMGMGHHGQRNGHHNGHHHLGGVGVVGSVLVAGAVGAMGKCAINLPKAMHERIMGRVDGS